MRPSAFQRILPPLFYILGGILIIYALRIAAPTAGGQRLVWAQVWHLAIIILVAGGLAVVFLRHSASRLVWEVILNAAIFLGVWYVFLLFGLTLGIAIVLSSGLTLAYLNFKTVWLHDIFYLLGATGVSINFAVWLPAEVLLLGLVAFTIYDMVAGVAGGPIHKLVAKLARHSLVPGLLIPKNIKSFKEKLPQSVQGEAIFLGAGDLILPLSLAAGAAFRGWLPALLVTLGASLGALSLGFRASLRPQPALLPLAIGVGIPFLLFTIL